MKKQIFLIFIFFNALTAISQNNTADSVKYKYWYLSEKIIPQNDVIPHQKTDTIKLDIINTDAIYLSTEFIRFYKLENGNLEIIDSAKYDISNNTIIFKEPNNRCVSIYTIKPNNEVLHFEMQTIGGIYIKKFSLLNN